MLTLNHKNLKAWQYSILLYKEICGLCVLLPSDEKYNIVSQIKRATLSISNNLAEGAAMRSPAERKRFFEVSRSSLVEVDNCLEILVLLSMVDKQQIKVIEELVIQIFKLLSVMIDKIANP